MTEQEVQPMLKEPQTRIIRKLLDALEGNLGPRLARDQSIPGKHPTQE
jgi:hypothetical protein